VKQIHFGKKGLALLLGRARRKTGNRGVPGLRSENVVTTRAGMREAAV